jgi:drug/metabolite transporter (DMT)-like permease
MDQNTVTRPDQATLFAFFTMVLIGGVNFVAVKFSNQEFAPFQGAAVRFAAASVLLYAVVGLRRIPLPRGRSLVGAVIYGVLSFAGFYALAYVALLTLSAGVAAIIMASVPLLTLFFASAHRVESLRGRGLAGALIAIAGIAVLVGSPANSELALPSVLMMIGASACAAESAVVIKRFPPSHPVATNAVAMSSGAALLFVFSALFGEKWILPAELSTWISVGYLILIGSVGLFGLFLFTLNRWTASGVSYMTVLIPVVAAISSALLAHEPITLTVAVGGGIVLAGVYVGALSGQNRSAVKDTVRTTSRPAALTR